MASGEELGSLYVDGVRVSARLRQQREGADTAGLEALIGAKLTGGRRRQRGGEFSMDNIGRVVEFAKRGANWAATTAAPLGPKFSAAFSETRAAGQAVADTSVKLIVLAIGIFRAIIGTSRGIIRNIGAAADSAEERLTDAHYQQTVADAITKDAPTAIVVAVLALTQAGVVSLSTVVALVLRAIGTGLTGTGRAVATVAFYVWYVQQTTDVQAKIKADANQVAGDLRTNAKDAQPRILAFAKSIKDGVKAALAKAKGEGKGGGLIAAASSTAGAGSAEEASVVKAANDLAAAGVAAVEAESGAAAVVLAAAVDDSAAAEEAETGAAASSAAGAEAKSPAAAKAEAEAAEAVVSAALEEASMGPGKNKRGRSSENGVASSSSSSSSSSSAAAVGAPDEGDVAVASAAPRVKAGPWKSLARSRRSVGDPGAAAAAASAEPAGEEGEEEGKKLRRAGRKTKKGKSKRRVTRRRKAPKYLAAPVFVY
jgi:hypothetical protein